MDVDDDDGLGTHFEVGRTAAFSDAVIAIAATLLVLDLRPPDVASGQTLGRAVAVQWPRYVALVSSFLVIGLIWVHHHRLFRLLDRADHTLLNLNLLLMLAVLIVPFPTALLAEYPYERVSAVLYTSVVAANALLFMLIWVHVRRREGLLRPGIPAVVIRLIGLQYRIAVITYLVLVVVSFVSVHVSIAGNILLAVFFALPLNAIKRREPLDRPIRRMVRRLPLNLSEDSVGTKRKIDEKDNGSRTLQSAQEQEPSSQTSQPKPMRNERSATAFPVPFALIRSLYDFANLTMGGLPRVDVTKRDEYFLVQIDLPGYRLEDVHVRIEDDKVVLEGERRSELRPTDGNAAERAYGRFRREIQLPANVDLETARATFETGVLEIAVRLPKEAKPRGGKIEIEINAAGKSTKSTTSG